MPAFARFKKSSIAVLLLMVIGLVSGLYLVQNQQELREQASTVEATIQVYDFESDSELSDWTVTKGTSSAGSVTTVSSENSIGPKSGSKMLKITRNSSYIQLDRTFPSSNKTLVSFSGYFYDPGPTVRRGFQLRVSNADTEYILGVNSTYFINNNYFIRPGKSDVAFFDSGIPRTQGWHKFEIRVTPIGTYGLIDDKNLSYLPTANGASPINHYLKQADRFGLAVTWNESGDYYFDAFQLNSLNDFQNVSDTSLNFIKTYLERDPDRFIDKFFVQKLDPASGKSLYYMKGSEGSRYLANYTLARSFECRFILSYSNNCVDEVTSLIHSLLIEENYNKWRGSNLNDSGSFIYNNSPLEIYPISLASWLIWDKIPNTTEFPLQQLIASSITYEANFWSAHPQQIRIPDASTGDSNAEVYAWTSAFLSLSGTMFDNDLWLSKGVEMSKEALNPANRGAPIGENPYKIYNHGIFHPGYFIYSLASLSETFLPYKLTGKSFIQNINLSNLNNFFNENLSSSQINYTDYRYRHGLYPVSWGYKDDWFRAPETNAISAFTFLKYIDPSRYTNVNLARYGHHINLESFLPMNIPPSELVVPSVTYDIRGDNFRSIIESTSPLYHIVTYLWESDLSLNPVPPILPTPTGTGSSSCSDARVSWGNVSISPQQGQFTAEFDVIPNTSAVDGVYGFSENTADNYTEMAAIVRFVYYNLIEVRNGSDYMADTTYPYTPGVKYHIRMEIDTASKTYNVYVSTDTTREVKIASNYSFRSEQKAVNTLNFFTFKKVREDDYFSVCGLIVEDKTSVILPSYLNDKPIPGDIHPEGGDGDVNIDDFASFSGTDIFGQAVDPEITPEDINKDGKVDIFDFNLLVTNFTEGG